jgi:hypothetical protein
MQTKFIKPSAENLLVLIPDENGNLPRPLDKDGELVRWSNYWRRRLKDGDIVIVSDNQEND